VLIALESVFLRFENKQKKSNYEKIIISLDANLF
jgi:hypothetical protein